MTNMEDGMNAVETAANSEGSAMAEQEKWLDSIEGKLGKVSAAFESLSTHLLNSDFIKFLLDAGGSLLNVLDALSSKSNSFAIITGTIITLTSTFTKLRTGIQYIPDEVGNVNRQFVILGRTIAQIKAERDNGSSFMSAIFGSATIDATTGLDKENLTHLQEFGAQFKQDQDDNKPTKGSKSEALYSNLIPIEQKYADDMKKGVDVTTRLAASLNKASIAATIARGALVALSQVALMFAVTAVITGVVKLLSYLQKTFIPTMNQLRDAAAESSSAYKDTVSTIKELNTELETTKTRILELESKGTLSIAEKDELDKLKDENFELEKQITLKKAVANTEALKAQEDAVKALTKEKNIGTRGALKDIDLLPDVQKTITIKRDELTNIPVGSEEWNIKNKELDNYNTKLKDMEGRISSYYSSVSKYKDALVAGTPQGDYWLGELTKLEDVVLNITGDTVTKMNNIFNKDEFSGLNEQLTVLANNGLLTESSFNSFTTASFRKQLEAAKIPIDSFIEQLKTTSNEAKKLQSSMGVDSLQSDIDNMSTYIDEYNKNGYLSRDSSYKMVKANPDYIKYLTQEEGLYKLNTDAINDYNDSIKAKNTLVDEFMAQQEKDVYGTREVAGAISRSLQEVGANTELPKDKLDSLNLANLENINKEFSDGTIGDEAYFQKLQQYSDSVDFSAFKSEITEIDETVQQTLEGIFMSIGQGVDYLTKQFQSGEISFNDYFDGMISAGKAAISASQDYSEVIKEPKEILKKEPAIKDAPMMHAHGMVPSTLPIYEKTSVDDADAEKKVLKDIGDSASETEGELTSYKESVDDVNDSHKDLKKSIEEAEELDGFVNFLNDNADTVNKYADDLGNIEFPSPDVEGYTEFANGLEAVLTQAGEGSSLFKAMAKAAEESTGAAAGSITTIGGLMSTLRDDEGAMNAAVKEGALTTGMAIAGIASNIGTVLQGISELIANFSATINIKVHGKQKFSGLTIPKSITLSGGDSSDETEAAINKITTGLSGAKTSLQAFSALTVQEIVSKGEKGKEEIAAPTKGNSQKSKETNNKLNDLANEEHLDKLKQSIEQVQLLVDHLNRSMETLDLSLELTSENDFASRLDLYASKYDIAVQKGQALRNEFDRLAATTPKTSDEAQELASRLESLGSEIQTNIKDVREYRNELDKIRLNAISASAENVMSQLEEEAKLVDYNINSLINGSMIDGAGAFSFDFLLPTIPEDALDRQRKENKGIEKEEQKHQNEIAAIKQTALDMQYAKLAETREQERQNLLENLNSNAEAINDKANEVSEYATTTATNTGTQVDTTAANTGIQAASSFMNNFGLLKNYLSTAAPSFATTFITGFAKGLSGGKNLLETELSKLINGGLAATGGIAGSEYSSNCVDKVDTNMLSIYAHSNNKYGGTHATDKGMDYAHPAGTPIPAAWAGTVSVVKDLGNRSYGKYVTIDSDDGKSHVYAHMSKQNAFVGQKVLKGQIIGYVGSTGHSTGNHVHVSNAWGTYIDTFGRKDGGDVQPNEQTLTGEYGRELAKLPNGKIVMLGANGAELCDLPTATKIINHKQTEEILKYTGKGIIGKRVKKYDGGNKGVDKTSNVPKFASGNVDPTWVKLAQNIQSTYGIPASLVLSQLILETGWGNSSVAKNANNYFGVKGKGSAGSYKGYRKYNSMEESFNDYAKNLLNSGYYKTDGLSSTDFKGWIGSIAETYAPNQGYESKVTQLANSYNLTQYDQAISTTASAAADAAQSASIALSAAEQAKSLVEKYTEIPQAYTKEFLLDYRSYAEDRSKNLTDVETIKKLDPERAKLILDAQREKDMEKSYEMKVNMYTGAAEKLKQNYIDLLAEFDKIKDTADVDVLQEYIQGLSTIQENLIEVDETLQEAAHGMYQYSKNSLDNQLKLLDYQFSEAEFNNNYAEMTVNYQKQLVIYQKAMTDAANEAARVRETGASEDAEYIQECIDNWWEAREALREYKNELENLSEQRSENYKDTLSNFQNSYIEIFNNALSDIQHQRNNDPVLQSLYDQKEALEKVNEERQTEVALMKAKENLAKLQKTTLVYQKGVGWVYKVDENSLREAKENLSNAQNDYDITKLDKQISDLEEFYDKQTEQIQKFIDNLKYEMEVYMREGATSIAELMDTLRDLGIDTSENIQKAMSWLDSLFELIGNDDYLKKLFGTTSGKDFEQTNQELQNDKFYNLLKEMIIKEQAIESADENTKKLLRADIDKLAKILGLTYADGIYYTKEGTDAYKLGAQLIQDEIAKNSEEMKDSDTLQIAILQNSNKILQDLYDFVSGNGKKDNTKSLIEEMVNNSSKWASSDDETKNKLHERNVEISKQLGFNYNDVNGTWFTDDAQKMESYAKYALDIMKQNSEAWKQTDNKTEQDRLHNVNDFLAKMFKLKHDNGSWFYENGTKAYSEGGIVDYSGYAEVHGGYASELVLKNADVAKLYDYIHNTPNLMTDAIRKVNQYQKIPNLLDKETNTITYQFGDIHVHSVQNPDEFSNALIAEMGTLVKKIGMSIK
ncbi:MAG: glucosaminidase domain-containing protein [Synergistaceae bacterium]